MNEIWIGVTGIHATDNPCPGLSVIRALRRDAPSWKILGLPHSWKNTGAYAIDMFDALALAPDPCDGNLLEWYRNLLGTQPLDVLIPTLDFEIPRYVEIDESLRSLGIRTVLPPEAALRKREKTNLPEFGESIGMAVPKTIVFSSKEDVRLASGYLRFPQVLKGAMTGSALVHSPEDLLSAASDMAGEMGYPLLAQKIVRGEEYDGAAVASRGELLGGAIMKKLSVTNKGTAWAGVGVEKSFLSEEMRRIVRALEWNGPLEAEFILTEKGQVYCSEVNPRFPSWIAMAAEAGANLPAMLVRLAMGEKIDPVHAGCGWLFTRAFQEHVFEINPLDSLKEKNGKISILHPGSNSNGRVVAAAGKGLRSDCIVAVTGLNAADNPSPGLTVGRALRKLPFPPKLVGLAEEIISSGIYVEDVWDEIQILPHASQEGGCYEGALLEACRSLGVNCLIPTLDREIPILAGMVPRLAEAGVATLLPEPESLSAISKLNLSRFPEKGIQTPRTIQLDRLEELPRAYDAFGFPFFLKGSWADARSIQNEGEGRFIGRRLASVWGFPLLAQEYIAGEEFSIAAVADREHRIVGAVVLRKEIQTGNGNTWGGTVTPDDELLAMASHFARAFRWVGPFEIEVIRHPKNGVFLIEVNPRFPSWVFLSAGAEANLPWAVVQLALGKNVSPQVPRSGAFYIRMAWDTSAPVERMGELAVHGRMAQHVS